MAHVQSWTCDGPGCARVHMGEFPTDWASGKFKFPGDSGDTAWRNFCTPACMNLYAGTRFIQALERVGVR